MSTESLEVVRRAFEAFRARDVKAMSDVFAAEGEWRPLLTAGGELERRVYRGPDGMAEYWADLDDLFEGTEMHIGALEVVAPDTVLFSGRVTARARQSGVPIDERLWAVYTVRDRQLVRGTAYRSRAEALEALGVRE